MKLIRQIDIEKVKRGDTDEFKSLYVMLYPKLKALACRFVDEDTAEDLTQDVFAAYWERKHLINADNISSFLFKWLQNDCLNHLRHLTVVQEYEAQIRIAEARIAYLENQSDTNETLQRIIDKDFHCLIEEAVNKLPPRCAEAFRLCYYRNLTHKEIAEIMNISPRTVEEHVRSALLSVRKTVGKAE